MKQEDKELLLRELCARLPYGVKGYVNGSIQTLQGVNVLDSIVEYDIYCNTDIEEFTLYLFPLSSMTEEVMDEIYKVSGVYDIGVDSPVHIEVGTTFEDLTKMYHILNKHHIDYRGLIPKGLATDATGLDIY